MLVFQNHLLDLQNLLNKFSINSKSSVLIVQIKTLTYKSISDYSNSKRYEINNGK